MTTQIHIDPETLILTLTGPAEEMDSIPDRELDAAAAACGLQVDWDRGPLDETSYALIPSTEP